MGLTYEKGPQMKDSTRYDEETSARLYLTSDHKVVVSEGDVRARFMLARHGKVSRAEAQNIRDHKDGDLYLYRIGDKPPVVPDIQRPAEAEAEAPPKAAASFGPDDPIDFGAYTGTKVRDIPEDYLRRMTYVYLHEDWAKAEEARREGKPVKKDAPAMPKPDDDEDSDEDVNLGPDDIVTFGKYGPDKLKVSNLPDKYLKALATGATVKHRAWAKAEIARRAG